MVKKIFGSRWVRIGFSIVLIYFAFKKVDVVDLVKQLVGVNPLFVVLNVLVAILTSGLVAYRWSLLLIKKPGFKDVWLFIKSAWAASFYGMFLPTAAAGDVLKWIIIDEKYPEIPKTKLLGSIVMDRGIGLSMFVFTGNLMLLLARVKGVTIPWPIELLFWGLFVGCIVFYVSLALGWLPKIWQIKWLKKFESVSDLIKKENTSQVFRCLSVSFVSELVWILQMWLICWYFGTGLSVMSIFIFLPVISMILALPISFAGFGAREQLFLFFFGSMARSSESLLLSSAFFGILGIINSLIGGLVTLTPDFKKVNSD